MGNVAVSYPIASLRIVVFSLPRHFDGAIFMHTHKGPLTGPLSFRFSDFTITSSQDYIFTELYRIYPLARLSMERIGKLRII